MARVWVYQCSEGRVVYTVTLSQNQYGACQNGKGSWIEVDTQAPFSISDLNPAHLAGAYGAGFVVMATGVVIGQACKAIFRAIF